MRDMSTVTSPFGALAVIVDPAAGDGSVASQVTAVQRALESRRIEHRIHVATGRQDVTRSAGLALDEGYRFVAAVGDDATVHDVVNGMFRDGRTIVETPVLAVLGAGSGGDLLKSFGLPDDVDQAAAHLEGEETYPFDVMKIAAVGRDGDRIVGYAHNVAEVGLHAAATAAAARLPRRLGNARRFLGFWSAYAEDAGAAGHGDGRRTRPRAPHLERDHRATGSSPTAASACRRARSLGTGCWTPRSSPDRGRTPTGCCPGCSATATTSPIPASRSSAHG